MTTEHSITKILENRGVEMHGKIHAIRSVGILGFTPEVCRGLIGDILQVDMKVVNGLVSDDVADKTLCYLIDQYFEPMGTLNLLDAYNRAVALRKAYPIAEPDPFINENPEEPEKVIKGGKVKKGYKKQTALSLYRKHKDNITEKAEWINLFIKEIEGMSRGVANTYIHNILTGKWTV